MQLVEYLYTWEIDVKELRWIDKEEGEYEAVGESDGEYFVTTDYAEHPNADEWFEQLIVASGVRIPPNSVVEVYEARWSTLGVPRNHKVCVEEADTATGYNGSPVYEKIVE